MNCKDFQFRRFLGVPHSNWAHHSNGILSVVQDPIVTLFQNTEVEIGSYHGNALPVNINAKKQTTKNTRQELQPPIVLGHMLPDCLRLASRCYLKALALWVKLLCHFRAINHKTIIFRYRM